MRSTEESTDTFGKLGPKVEQPAPKPAEVWKPTDSKYIQESGGKLRTNLPEPTWPAPMPTPKTGLDKFLDDIL